MYSTSQIINYEVYLLDIRPLLSKFFFFFRLKWTPFPSVFEACFWASFHGVGAVSVFTLNRLKKKRYLCGSKSPLHVLRWPRVEKVDKKTDLIYSATNSTVATQRFYSNHKMSTEQKERSSFNSQSDLTLICDWSERNQLRLFYSELVLWLAEKSWVAPIEFITL